MDPVIGAVTFGRRPILAQPGRLARPLQTVLALFVFEINSLISFHFYTEACVTSFFLIITSGINPLTELLLPPPAKQIIL